MQAEFKIMSFQQKASDNDYGTLNLGQSHTGKQLFLEDRSSRPDLFIDDTRGLHMKICLPWDYIVKSSLQNHISQ